MYSQWTSFKTTACPVETQTHWNGSAPEYQKGVEMWRGQYENLMPSTCSPQRHMSNPATNKISGVLFMQATRWKWQFLLMCIVAHSFKLWTFWLSMKHHCYIWQSNCQRCAMFQGFLQKRTRSPHFTWPVHLVILRKRWGRWNQLCI